jgi:catechol 2,3-dioxygenase-like lactoylglutathione lyase family enzyme
LILSTRRRRGVTVDTTDQSGHIKEYAPSAQSVTALRKIHSIFAPEREFMSNAWYARPVLFVADIDRSVDFYVNQLGFSEPWRYEEDGQALVAQVERQGCEIILSSQWPDKVGKGLMFISLDVEVLDALRAELEGRGVDLKDGNWGYRLMVIVDPDGNELYFPYPSEPKGSRDP